MSNPNLRANFSSLEVFKNGCAGSQGNRIHRQRPDQGGKEIGHLHRQNQLEVEEINLKEGQANKRQATYPLQHPTVWSGSFQDEPKQHQEATEDQDRIQGREGSQLSGKFPLSIMEGETFSHEFGTIWREVFTFSATFGRQRVAPVWCAQMPP